MKRNALLPVFLLFSLLFLFLLFQRKPNDSVRVLVLTERGGQHEGFVAAALTWLGDFGEENGYVFTEFNEADEFTDSLLDAYDVFLQLDFPPYTWSSEAENAFVKAMEEGRIGWVGFHHATLLGEFDGYPMWQWFSDFMGGIQFQNYIAETASANLIVEDGTHPVMKGVSPSFVVPDDEWYTFDRNPRDRVHVLATVDESTYEPASDIRMGDHPAVWVNPRMKARNVYFLMGHSGKLLENPDFTRMFSNALLWAAGEDKNQ